MHDTNSWNFFQPDRGQRLHIVYSYHTNTWKGETLCTTQQEACISHGVTCCYCTLPRWSIVRSLKLGVTRRNAAVADVHLPHKDDTRKGPKLFGQRHFGLCRIRKGIHYIYIYTYFFLLKIPQKNSRQKFQRAGISNFMNHVNIMSYC